MEMKKEGKEDQMFQRAVEYKEGDVYLDKLKRSKQRTLLECVKLGETTDFFDSQ